MARFQVDPEVLGEAATRLENQRQRLTDLRARAAVGDLGDPRVVSQVHRTELEIAQHLEQATDAVAGMVNVLRRAGQTYRGSDDQIRTWATSIAGAPGEAVR
jgi:hypothetical protein